MAARTPQCALITMQKLAWAYLARAAAGDFSRSSVVLSKFALAYPGVRGQLASATGVAALPSRIDEYFSEMTAGVLGFVLSAAAIGSDGAVANPQLRANALQIRTRTAANVGELYRTGLDPLVSAGAELRAFEGLVAQHEASALGTALDGAIAESFECASTGSFSEMISDLVSGKTTATAVAKARSSSSVIEGETFTIRARSGQAGLPTWALWGIGALCVGLGGWAIYEAAR